MNGKYRTGYVLDILRFVRGVLFPKTMDPFIQTWPRGIVVRKNLFQWSMISEESGDYVYQYPDYVPYLSSQPLLMIHLPERYGRDAYAHLMEAKSLRLQQIHKLLSQYGLQVEATDDFWIQVFGWLEQHFVSSLEPAALELNNQVYYEIRTRPLCYSIITDLGLLLGEHIIELRSDTRWVYWGDVPNEKASGLGREPWLIRDPAVGEATEKSADSRILPMYILGSLAGKASTQQVQAPEKLLTSLCK